MSRNRQKGQSAPAVVQPAPPAEVLPSAPTPEAAEAQPMSVLPGIPWKTIGIASVVLTLMVVFGVYNHIQGQLNSLRSEAADLSKELRGEVGKLSESYVSLVKKDEHTTRMRNVWDRIKELRADRSDLTTMQERCKVMAELHQAGLADRKELGEQIAKLRERSRGEEEKKQLIEQLRALKERLAQAEGKSGFAVGGHAD